jgi:glycosyltransferase involved in cell wall biosynthesis
VYNNASHLKECIESVLAQTYTNWDYTIVDNCSSDGSAEIALRLAEKDPRIRVSENKRFLRALENHNAALRHISPASTYSKVVFGDDWIFPECLEKMVSLAEKHPSVGIVGAYALEGTQVRWTGLPYPSHVTSGREICREHLLRDLFVFGSANSVLYRADLVRRRDLFYNEAHINADDEVCFELLKNCDFGFVHQVLTFTRVREGSLSAISGRLQTSFPGFLNILLTYGRDYLTAEEYQARLHRHVCEYYRFLGKSVMLNHDATFWDYHTTRLAELGVGFSRARLVKGMLQTLLGALLNPKDSFSRLLKRRYNQKWPNRKFDHEMSEPLFRSFGYNSIEERSSSGAAQQKIKPKE